MERTRRDAEMGGESIMDLASCHADIALIERHVRRCCSQKEQHKPAYELYYDVRDGDMPAFDLGLTKRRIDRERVMRSIQLPIRST